MKIISISSILFFFLISCAHHADRGPASSQATIPITILHTNDVHGHAWPLLRKDGVVRGGLAAMAALVDKIRQEVESRGGALLLLSAGDVNTGVPESDLLKAEPDLRAMSMMKFDAMVVGNHDLDGGLEKLDAQRAWTDFPVLTANVTHGGGSPIRNPFLVLEKGGLVFGIVGLTTDTLKQVVLARHTNKLEVLDPVLTMKTYLPKLKEKGVDVYIALTHMGVSQTGKRATQKIGRDDQQLAREIPELHVIIGGHSHTLLPDGLRVNDTLIAQSGEKGEYLGRVDLVWNPQTKKIVQSKAAVIPILPAHGEHAKIKAFLDEQKAKVSKMLDEEIGVTQNELDGEREHIRHGETNLGNLVCDILVKMTKTEACLFNGGGIRASIPKGSLRLRDLYRVLPFGNTAVTGVLTGRQIKEALQTGLKYQHQSGSFLQVSGLRYAAKDGRLRWVKLGKARLSDSAKVRVVSNNFLFDGGDYLEVLTKASDIQDTGIPVEELLAKYIKVHPTVYSQRDDRIQVE